jgi:hypothetical protein
VLLILLCFYTSVIVLFFVVFRWCPGAYYAVLVSCSCGVVLPIMLFYCRVIVMWFRATYYLILTWSCRGVSCYLLLLVFVVSVAVVVVVSCYLFYFILSLSCHVVLPIMLVDCRVVYCIIFANR